MSSQLRLPILIALLVAASLQAGKAAAAETNGPAQADSMAPRELQLQVSASGEAGARTAEVRQPVARSVMAYRFSIDVSIDDAADGAEQAGDWIVVLRAGGDGARTLLHFSPVTREFTLPRPLGLRLNAGDSLMLSVSLADDERRTISVRMRIELEAPNRRSGRLAVQPARAQLREGPDSLTTTWEWSPASDGRIMAVAGVPFAGAADVSVTDLDSEAILWSTGAHSETGVGSAAASGVLWLGVPVHTGRTYRLSVTFHRMHHATSGAAAMVMMHPARRHASSTARPGA